MLNRVILMGRITQELELKTTASGISVTSFSIAVDRNYVKQGEQRQTDSLYMTFSIFGYTPRVSQILSTCIFVTGIVLLIIFRKKRNVKNGDNN